MKLRSNLDLSFAISEAIKIKKDKEDIKRWPVHIYAQASMVSKHANDLATLAYNIKYANISDADRMILYDELKRTAHTVMAANIRFLEKLRVPEADSESISVLPDDAEEMDATKLEIPTDIHLCFQDLRKLPKI
jgi:hypothetical protein